MKIVFIEFTDYVALENIHISPQKVLDFPEGGVSVRPKSLIVISRGDLGGGMVIFWNYT